MSLRILLTTTVLLAVASEALSQTVTGPAPRTLLVKWKGGPTSSDAMEGNAAIGTVVRTFHAIGWQAVELPPNLSLGAAMAAYLQLGTAAAVEPDGQLTIPGPSPLESEPTANTAPAAGAGLPAAALSPPDSSGLIPNDPLFAQQWNLKIIGATNAWAVTTGSAEVVVAVFDTGIDYTHPDLAPNMWRNPGETGFDNQGRDKTTNGIDDDGNGYVDDVHGINVWDGTGDPLDRGWSEPPTPTDYHGTGCAGVIGAVGNNGIGVAGVNWSVKLMAIKVLDQSLATNASPPRFFTTSGMLAAWNYVVDMKRRGVNVRVTSHSEGLIAYHAAVRDAILTAHNEGIVSVVAAGNATTDRDVFSGHANVQNMAPLIYVAATDETDQLASFSNFGKSTVHLAAPGVLLPTLTGGTGYRARTGTSFACPLVAGSAALLLAANPSLTVDEVKAALFGSVDRIASVRDKVITGGRLNLARAMEYLTNANPPAIVLAALPAGQRTPTNLPIQVTFSRPMNRASVESALVVTPALSGTFAWPADNRSFSFTPDTSFDRTTNYTVRMLGSAQDEQGGTLDGNFNQLREGSPTDDLVWTFRFPVPNDDFADAQPLVGVSGAVNGNNRYTIWEAGEPTEPSFFDLSNFSDVHLLASVWYRWTPPEPNGWFTFDLTSGTAFDSYLEVYTGNRLEQLIRVASNDNYGTGVASRVSFYAEAGTNYSISVIGMSRSLPPTESGPFQLRWYLTPPPILASFTPTSGYPGQKVTINGTNFTGATRVLFNGVPAQFTLSTNAAFTDLQLTATVPLNATTGRITIETPHGNFTTSSNFNALIPPALAIRTLPGNLLEVSWPVTLNFGFQRADSLSATSIWTNVATVSARLSNGIRYVTVTNGVPSRFFRLYRP